MTKGQQKTKKVVIKIPQNIEEFLQHFTCDESEETLVIHVPDGSKVKVSISNGHLWDNPKEVMMDDCDSNKEEAELDSESEVLTNADVLHLLCKYLMRHILHTKENEIEIAKKMLAHGANIDLVLKSTSLNEETVEALL